MRFTFILLVLVILISEMAVGQSFYAIRRERSLIAQVGVGTSTYFGELANPGDYIDGKPSVSVGAQYFFTDRISVRTELMWFQLQGDDAKADDPGRIHRNLSFTANNWEFSATATINLFALGQRFYQRPKFNVYAFAGVGLLYSNPKGELDGEKHALQPLRTEGVSYNRLQPVIPYGLGIRVMVTPFLNVALEGAYRLTFTDYLDDVSTTYIDNASFSDPIASSLADRRPEIDLPLAEEGAKRGNPESNDVYMTVQLKIEYYLPIMISGSQSKLYKAKRRAINRRR